MGVRRWGFVAAYVNVGGAFLGWLLGLGRKFVFFWVLSWVGVCGVDYRWDLLSGFWFYGCVCVGGRLVYNPIL